MRWFAIRRDLPSTHIIAPLLMENTTAFPTMRVSLLVFAILKTEAKIVHSVVEICRAVRKVARAR